MGNIYVKLKFKPVVQEKMSFKDITYLELWPPFSSAERNYLCNFRRGYHEEFGPVVQEEMSLKIYSYLELWLSFCSAEWNHLRNFVIGYQEEQF